MTAPTKPTSRTLYIIGSLRNPAVPLIGDVLRADGFDVFDDWFAGGEGADDAWRDYERGRGRTYAEALNNHSARNVFELDQFHLNRAHAAILVLPAGRSGHLEAGMMSATKPVFALLDSTGEPERLDVMSRFMHGVYADVEQLRAALGTYPWPKTPKLAFHTVGDAQWLSGVFEGDGTFCITGKIPRMVLQMTDEDVVARAAKIMGSSVWNGKKLKSGKTMYMCGAAGLNAVEWMRVVRPYMGRRRQGQIVKTVRSWLDQRGYNKRDHAWWERVFQLNTLDEMIGALR